MCAHPEHMKFHAHISGALTKDAACKLYNALRQKRRDEFTANLDETSRIDFNRQTDFFGKPLTNN
jgi:hypothetical protein